MSVRKTHTNYTNDALRHANAGVVFPGATRRVVAVVVDVSLVCNAFNSAFRYAICINKFTASYYEKTDCTGPVNDLWCRDWLMWEGAITFRWFIALSSGSIRIGSLNYEFGRRRFWISWHRTDVLHKIRFFTLRWNTIIKLAKRRLVYGKWQFAWKVIAQTDLLCIWERSCI